jgi:glucoamylase
MNHSTTSQPAFGAPGISPRWTRSDKDGIVSAYSASSRIWATLSAGIVNEVYSPSIESPQIRDLQFLLTDGETFFHDERRHATTETTLLSGNALGYRITNCDPGGRYTLEKQIIATPHADCLLVYTKTTIAPEWQGKIKVFALLAPHLDVGGCGNSGHVGFILGRQVLTANRNDHWLAMDCCCGFARTSCGYVGTSDGWTDGRT